MGRTPSRTRFGITVAAAAVLALLNGCADSTEKLPDGTGYNQPQRIASSGGAAPEGQRRSFARDFATPTSGAQIPVNPFLWRAALDTVSFMPINSADAYGGAIVTDWFAPPETPTERFKLNVLIQGTELRSDGVKVTVFRQTREDGTSWTDAPVENNTAIDMENVILLRARELRQDYVNR